MLKHNSNPIGIFDSGLGGLSILHEIHKELPNEDIIYFADSKNAPYGLKSKEEIKNLSICNTSSLLSESCKIIVVACNTATTNAIKELRDSFPIPFIGIEPAIKPASILSSTGEIGILATKGTLSSSLFSKHAELISKKAKIIEVVGKGIVEAIENNDTHTTKFEKLLAQQLQPFKDSNIDNLVLGCSHYPFIKKHIQKILGENIKIIDSGEAVAKQTKKVIQNNSLANHIQNKGKVTVHTNNTNQEALQSVLKHLQILDVVKK